MTGKSCLELEQSGFVIKEDTKGVWAYDPSHQFFLDITDPTKASLELALKHQAGEDITSVPLFRRRKFYEEAGDNVMHHVSEFVLRIEKKKLKSGEKTIVCFDPKLLTEKSGQAKEKRDLNRAANMPICRYYVMGNSATPIHCPMRKIQIESVMFWGKMRNSFQQHHILYRNGKSVHKGSEDPNKLLTGGDLTDGSTKSRTTLLDMMRTTFVSSDAHAMIHASGRSGGIQQYQKSELPWALRSKQNWNRFTGWLMTEYGYDPFPTYDEWYNGMIL